MEGGHIDRVSRHPTENRLVPKSSNLEVSMTYDISDYTNSFWLVFMMEPRRHMLSDLHERLFLAPKLGSLLTDRAWAAFSSGVA